MGDRLVSVDGVDTSLMNVEQVQRLRTELARYLPR